MFSLPSTTPHLSPYLRLMRLHQPVGIWLLLWPCWWSLAIAGASINELHLYVLFALGAVVMRGAGCVINDIFDRTYDALVERTKARPIASGEITIPQAIVFLHLLLLIAFFIAVALGWKVVLWSAASLPLVALYPLMKRITWWPQLFLGLTFNWGALVGWVAVYGEIGWQALVLYMGCMFWTLGYDTIYAHQDKQDDVKIGVKSTALLFGTHTKKYVGWCYSVFMATLVLTLPFSIEAIACLLLVYAAIIVNLCSLSINDVHACKRSFTLHAKLGAVIFLIILLVR